MIGRLADALRRFFLCDAHRIEIATLRAEVRDLRRHERSLWEANREFQEHIRRVELQRDATMTLLERVLEDSSAQENILQ